MAIPGILTRAHRGRVAHGEDRGQPAPWGSAGTRSRAHRGVQARKTQTRLREMVEILRRVEAYTGSSPIVAYAWFRSEVLPGFAGKTPDQLVREGEAGYVHACLDRIVSGGYA